MPTVPETAEPILSNVPESFSWGVLHQRHPALVQQVRDSHPYPPEYQRALDQLLNEITAGPIGPLREDTPDRAQWDRWSQGYLGQLWPDVPFLWAESYFYRKLLEAVGYFRPGPWQGVDPFAPQKSAELADPALETELVALDNLADLAPTERSSALIQAVTILKGDLNYRRLVGDRYWPATTSFAALTGYFPGPVVTLRTLKSDVVAGLDEATVAKLDGTANAWRTSGTHALIQAHL